MSIYLGVGASRPLKASAGGTWAGSSVVASNLTPDLPVPGLVPKSKSQVASKFQREGRRRQRIPGKSVQLPCRHWINRQQSNCQLVSSKQSWCSLALHQPKFLFTTSTRYPRGGGLFHSQRCPRLVAHGCSLSPCTVTFFRSQATRHRR